MIPCSYDVPFLLRPTNIPHCYQAASNYLRTRLKIATTQSPRTLQLNTHTMYLCHTGKSIAQIAQSNEKKSSGKTSHSFRSLSKWTYRIRNRARTNIPDQSTRIPERVIEVVPANRPTTSSSARIRIALDTARDQGDSPGQSLCELCMDLNLLFEIVRLRAFESLGTCGAEQYSIAAQQGCQDCAAIAKFLSELSYRWCRSLKLPAVGNTTYFKLRSLLAQFVHGGNYNLNRLQVDSIDISCYAGE
jgi:hypothetical protein